VPRDKVGSPENYVVLHTIRLIASRAHGVEQRFALLQTGRLGLQFHLSAPIATRLWETDAGAR